MKLKSYKDKRLFGVRWWKLVLMIQFELIMFAVFVIMGSDLFINALIGQYKFIGPYEIDLGHIYIYSVFALMLFIFFTIIYSIWKLLFDWCLKDYKDGKLERQKDIKKDN